MSLSGKLIDNTEEEFEDNSTSRIDRHLLQVAPTIADKPSEIEKTSYNEKIVHECPFTLFNLSILLYILLGIFQILYFMIVYMDIVEREFLPIYTYIGSYFALIGITIVIAYIFVICTISFPKIFPYITMIISFLGFGSIIFYGYTNNNIVIEIISGTFTSIYLLCIIFYYKEIIKAINLFTQLTEFLKQNYSALLFSPILKIFISIMTCYLGSLSLNASVESLRFLKEQNRYYLLEGISITLMSMLIYAIFHVLYHVMTFSLSDICANWFYNLTLEERTRNKNIELRSFKHLGSFFFSIPRTLISSWTNLPFLQKGTKSNSKPLQKLCKFLTCYKDPQLQSLQQMTNRFTTIIQVITKEDFFDGRKTAAGLLRNEQRLITITNILSNLFLLWGWTLTVGIPTICSYFIVRYFVEYGPLDESDVWDFMVIVAVSSLIISTPVIITVSEITSCLLVYYALDNFFIENKIKTTKRIEGNIRGAFMKISKGNENYSEEEETVITRSDTNPENK